MKIKYTFTEDHSTGYTRTFADSGLCLCSNGPGERSDWFFDSFKHVVNDNTLYIIEEHIGGKFNTTEWTIEESNGRRTDVKSLVKYHELSAKHPMRVHSGEDEDCEYGCDDDESN